MSEQNTDSGEKTHAPTPKRRQDARNKGDVARSPDAATAGSYIGLIILLFIALTGTLADQLTHLKSVFQYAGHPGFDLSSWARRPLLLATLGLGLPAFCAVLVYLITGAIAFSPQALRPKFQRIDPIAQAKQKYGSLGLVEFAKTFVKFLAIGAGLVLVLYAFLPTIMLSLHASPGQVTLAMGVLLWRLLLITTGIALVIGLADLFWQNYSHTKKLRMSHQDLRDETKEAEGDPFLKAQRRKRGEDIATNQMLTDMADSSVVIVNPTHYAVALRWNVAMGGAPVCVAKGTDEIAARMREVAAEHGIPIRHDPPTARALHATVRLGQQIPRDLYHAVAAALRYADDLRNLKPGRGP